MTVKRKDKVKVSKATPGAMDTHAQKAHVTSGKNFPVVGIGASAGGLAAFEAFFSGMPSDTDPGMAFVLVQHLDPNHKSILAELVKRYTRMSVLEVEDGMEVRPNCAYIIPPNRDMALLNGTLQLLEQVTPHGQRLPIDFFFRSLAHDQRERAICIVLSGTGSDGTLGVRAVKGEGGMVMVQDPESTEFDGMPKSAIATGLVDYVLPSGEMAARLIAFTSQLSVRKKLLTQTVLPNAKDAIKKIFILLRNKTGHDFSQYKENTIHRRIERRMAILQIEDLDGYMRYLQKNPAESEALFRDLLIGVTSFFRDPEVFRALDSNVINNLFTGKPSGALIRIWVVGCSTGEEAYSIAILVREKMEAMNMSFNIQVFATDIDSQAIDAARAGIFPANIVSDVSKERLARFFTMESDGNAFRIHKNIREMLVFSEQDVVKDTPFSRIDLISCRNLLIYMDAELQKRLIPLFHYALNPGGYLFLGTSETVGEFVDFFGPLDRKSKIYQRKDGAYGATRPAFGKILPSMMEKNACPRSAGKTIIEKELSLCGLIEQELLKFFSPVAVLVNERGDILYLYGRTGRYLEPAPGVAGMNILKMAREGMRQELVMALSKAVTKNESVQRSGIKVKTNGDFVVVNLTIRQVAQVSDTAGVPSLFLVIFEEALTSGDEQLLRAEVIDSDQCPDAATMDMKASMAALKQELKAKDEYLQTTVEELQTSNEELRSSNEEMQSVNEELQSTNEELETSKEELQSVNEELATVNAELQQKVADLSRVNNDMNNLLATTSIGTIFVDHQLRIQRFTPEISHVINLIKTDVGRPVGHIVSNLVGYDSLVSDVQAVLDNLIPIEIEVQTRAGLSYLLRIRPYRTLDNVIEGAVIMFIGITELKREQEMVREIDFLRHMAVVVRDTCDAVTMQDMKGRILAWNPAAERMYGWSEAEAINMNIVDFIPADRREEALNVFQQLSHAKDLKPYRTQRITRDGKTVEVWITASALINDAGEVYAISTTERYLSELHGD